MPLEDLLDPLVLDADAQRLLFTEARSVTEFADVQVTDAQLRAIYELAKFPPTLSNTNPMRILFLRSGSGRDKLVPLMTENNRAQTAAAPISAIIAADLDFYENMPELQPSRPDLRELFGGFDPALRERLATYNSALQAAYLILAIRAAGLSAGPMTGFNPKAIDAEFFADCAWQTHMVINFGVAAPVDSPRLPRLSYEQAVRHG